MSQLRGAGVPRLIGGEMQVWSDAGPSSGRAPVTGAVLAELLDAAVPAGGRVLLAGPHEPGLLDALCERGARVTCLLRSLPDATAVAGRGGPPGAVEVLCGTLPKLVADEGFDAVVALDGLHRLCSVEGPQYGWAESLQALVAVLRPGGALLVSVENELGVHRLVDRSAATAPRDDAGWSALGEFDASRPGAPAELRRRLVDGGLGVTLHYAAWPSPEAPSVLAAPEAMNEPDGALVATVATACGSAFAGRPVLTDPRRLGAAAVRAGLGMEFAPAWVVLAHRAPAPPAASAPVLVADPEPGSGVVQEMSRTADGRWLRRVARAGRAAPPGTGLARALDRLDGPVPSGRPFEEVLLAASLRHDLPAVRRLLRGYRSWLAAQAEPDGALPGGYAFATVDNLLLDGDRFDLVDPSWSVTGRVEPSVAVVRALRRFAVTLSTGGYAHPWPSASDVDDLTALLGAMAGVPVDADVRARAVCLEADIAAARGGLTAAERATLIQRLAAPLPASPPAGPDGWREREVAFQQLREQFDSARAKLAWYEGELTERDVELRRLRLLVATFSGSAGYRLLRAAAGLARLGKRLARRVLRRR